jgi:hypothetical protein
MSFVAISASASGDFLSAIKQPEVRPVGTMTVGAFSFRNRGMLVLALLIS